MWIDTLFIDATLIEQYFYWFEAECQYFQFRCLKQTYKVQLGSVDF